MNTIPQDQNTEKQLDRLAAQRELYSVAKKIQMIQMILSVPCVIIWSFLIALIPDLKAYAGLWGMSVTALDLLVFTPWQNSKKEQAARIQELFDCDILQMECAEVKLGDRPDAELIAEFSAKYRNHDPDYDQLINWYPVIVGVLPIHLGRIVCQRANCWWDAKLRRRYANLVIATIVSMTVIVLASGMIGGMTLEKFFLAVLAPLLPAFTWGLRQVRDNYRTAKALDRIKKFSEKLWREALSKEKSIGELRNESRHLQDLIFDNRSRSPIIFDKLYKMLRKEYEEQLNMGAETLVHEARLGNRG